MRRTPQSSTLVWPVTALVSVGLCAALLGTGCPARQGPPEHVADPLLTPAVLRLPEGCLQPLSGLYRHAEDARYEYRAQDDGRRLVMEVSVHTEDGGVRALGGDHALTVALERGPEGFLGVTRAQVRTPGGVLCAVDFPTRLQACSPQGLTLETAATVAVDEQCQPPSTPDPTPFTSHTLLREPVSSPPQVPDAG